MHRAITAESIHSIFCTSTPWVNIAVYLKWYPNYFWSSGEVGMGILATPSKVLASNTVHCAIMHTCDC